MFITKEGKMRKVLTLFAMVVFIFISFINCSDDEVTNPVIEARDYELIAVPAISGYPMGYGGTILRTTDGGITWMSQTSGIGSGLYGVLFTDANTGTAVGDLGTILRTTDGGATWVSQTSGTNNLLYDVSFTNVNTGTAVGLDGTILRTTNGGATWMSQTSGTSSWLTGVSFMDASIGTAVGEDGTILRTTDGGTTWVSQTSGTSNWLLGVSVSFTIDEDTTGIAVGWDGTILRTEDGGTTWESQRISGTSNRLTGVSLTSAETGTAVGRDGVATPVHTVSLDGFQIGKCEVPYALWAEVKAWAESNGYIFANPGNRGSIESTSTDQHPVTMINRRDCIAWCNAYSEKEELTPVYYFTSTKTTAYRNSSTGGDISKDCVDWAENGFRLPTEAEWEYAARYIDGLSVLSGDHHSGYNLNPDIGDCAWYYSNSVSSTHPVEQLQANSLGAKDMSGNVWEWCWDWHEVYPSTPQHNPLGPISGTYHILRGGSWYNPVTVCRTANRGWGNLEYKHYNVGFRVCRSDLL